MVCILKYVTYGTDYAKFLALQTIRQFYDCEIINFPIAVSIAKNLIFFNDFLRFLDNVESAQALISDIHILF